MIRLTWEEIALVVLFSAMIGGSILKGNWWTVGAAGVFVAAIIVAGARSPQETTDVE